MKRSVVGFAVDPVTESVLRNALRDLAQLEFDRSGTEISHDIRRGTLKTAVAAMMRAEAPDILIVDIGNDFRSLRTLAELCDVLEPSVSLFVLGEIDDIALYRSITGTIGATDYLFKPITREAVARYFGPLISKHKPAVEPSRGGRVVALTGARGGVGTSTLAAGLALFLGETANRHTLLLDADLFAGLSAELCGVDPGADLLAALDGSSPIHPDLISASILPVRDRLHVLAAKPDRECGVSPKEGAAHELIGALRLRFNFIIVDLPFLPLQSHRELLECAHHRVIVLDPSIACLRDTLRLLALPNGPMQPQQPTILLNRANIPGALSRKRMEDTLKRKVDIVLADLPHRFDTVRSVGDLGVQPRDPLYRAIAALAREAGFEPGSTPVEKIAIRATPGA